MANLFPRPKNIDWSKFRTFGYPWHGKWEQKQVNGVWKDTLTLKSEHDGEETPAPVDENGDSRIPKLPSGAHLIDVQMPWAAEDLRENTPDNIRALGGKYWNRALFSPGNPAYLYGKSIGAADALYAAPDGSIWAYRLQIDTGGYWVPVRGGVYAQGTLVFMMKRVAGKLRNPPISNDTSTLFPPLMGAQGLMDLFPGVMEEVSREEVRRTYPFIDLSFADPGTQTSRPTFRFQDAIPNGSRALYAITLDNSARKNYNGPTALKELPAASCITHLIELSLSGVPGSAGFEAGVSAKGSPSTLGSDERLGTSAGKIDWFGDGGSSDYFGGTTVDGEPYIFDTIEFTNVVLPENETRSEEALKFTVLAGYDSEGAIKKISFEATSKGTSRCTAQQSGGGLDISCPQYETATGSASCFATITDRLSFQMEAKLGGEVILRVPETTITVVTELYTTLTLTISSAPNSNSMERKFVWDRPDPVYPSSPPIVAQFCGMSLQLPVGVVRTFTRGTVIDNAPLGKLVASLPPPLESNTPLGIGVSVVGVGAVATFGLMCGVCMVTPQTAVVACSHGYRGTADYYYGKVISFGEATTPPIPTPFSALPPKYISWCPIRDQLLTTDRPSSWI